MGGQGAGHGRRRRRPGRARLGAGQQGHRPGRHARRPLPRASPCSTRRSTRRRPATSATCSTGPSPTCWCTRAPAGRRSAATRSCNGCGRPASGPAGGRRRPAGPSSAARSPSSRATWRRPLSPFASARRSELAPLEGWIDPLWVDLHEASLLLETGDLDQAEALLRSRRRPGRASSVDPCDAAWLWAVRLAVAARRDDLEAARAALAAYLTARLAGLELEARHPRASTVWSPPCGPGCPPARSARCSASGDARRGGAGDRSSPRRPAASTWRPPCWRPPATASPPSPPTAGAGPP